MTDCLSRLLSPLSPGSFLEHYQAREHFHVARSCPDFYAGLLTIHDLDTVLQSSSLPVGMVNLVKDGARYPIEDWSRFVSSARGPFQIAIPEKILSLYDAGATVVLNGANAVLPALGETCRSLTQELGFPTQMNIYITPRSAAGFSKHSDEHDVLILQIAGSKAWRIYPAGSARVEIDVRCGELLYIPSGVFHDAESRDEDSIHITLGLRPTYGFELIRDLAGMTKERKEFQRPVPPRFAGDDALRLFEADFLASFQAFMAEVNVSALTNQHVQNSLTQHAETWPGRFADLRILSRMSPDTVVRRRAEIPATVIDDGKFLQIASAGRQVTVPVFMREQLHRILENGEFAVREINGMITDAGRIKLAGELVKAGFLSIVSI